LECWNVLLLRSSLGAACAPPCRALHCSSMASPSRAGASARRGVTAPNARACMEVPSACASCKICCQGQITQRRMPDLWQKDSNAIRYEDQEVRRSNTH
jgi:hypothetical protein